MVAASKWEVVGGAEKGGILVREGCALTSPAIDEILCTGATVETVEVAGGRLRYQLLTGKGPTEGWVSLQIRGKVLLAPLEVRGSSNEKEAVNVVVQGKRWTDLLVPACCTAGEWKRLLEEGGLLDGQKVMYARKLSVSSRDARGAPIRDAAPLPVSPDTAVISGPAAVLSMLSMGLEKMLGKPTVDTPPQDELATAAPVLPMVLKASGGDEHLTFHCNGLQGCRDDMEDRTLALLKLPGFESASLFGVFDGHGGQAVADALVAGLPRAVASALKEYEHDPSLALTQAFLRFDRDLQKAVKLPLVGSTATVCLVLRGEGELRLFCANLGDSRAVLCRNAGEAEALTIDHKPNLPQEMERIQAAGGTVDFKGRIQGGLNVSRSFGDFGYKQRTTAGAPTKVSAEPDVVEVKLDRGVNFVVMGSDGLFDVVSNEELVDSLHGAHTRGASIEDKVHSTLEQATEDSNDNACLCLVRFMHEQADR